MYNINGFEFNFRRNKQTKQPNIESPLLLHPLLTKYTESKDQSTTTMAPKGSKVTELTLTDRKAIFTSLISEVKDGVLIRGSIAKIAKIVGTTGVTVSRVWKQSIQKIAHSLNNHNHPNDVLTNLHLLSVKDLPDSLFKPGKYGNVGQKQKYDRDEIIQRTLEIPYRQRKTYRALASKLGISHQLVYSLLKKENIFKRHRSSVLPTLTEDNKYHRVMHCMDKIDPASQTGTRSEWKFKDFFDEVHIDEKWFYLCREKETYILISDREEGPTRRTKHKSHITKIMFMCAQARPRWVARENQYWDGKIGMWPIGSFEPAERASANRPRGTMVWRNKKLDIGEYLKVMCENIIPAIREKWPTTQWNDNSFKVIIQQDGATPHRINNDARWLNFLQEQGLQDKIKLITQPPNSPDLNINDLGFFRALQTQYHMLCPRNAAQIIEMVLVSYEDYDRRKINRIWVTYQTVMNQILQCNGDNAYQIPHMNKEKLEREGNLPVSIPVTAAAMAYWH